MAKTNTEDCGIPATEVTVDGGYASFTIRSGDSSTQAGDVKIILRREGQRDGFWCMVSRDEVVELMDTLAEHFYISLTRGEG